MKPRKPDKGIAEIRVEYQPLSALFKAPRNPKGHDLGAIAQSFARFGFVSPIIVNEATGRIVAGHGRLETLERERAEGQPPPERIKTSKAGEWLVPVIRGIAFRDDQEAETYLLADNRLVELGAWDEESLATLLHELGADQLTGTGYEPEDVESLLQRMSNATDEFGQPPDSVAQNVQEMQSIKDQRKQGNEQTIEKTDTEKYLVIVYQSREHKQRVLRRLGLPDDERYLDASLVDIRLRQPIPRKDSFLPKATPPRHARSQG